MNKRRSGSLHEEAVALYMEAQGMTVLFRNFRTRYGELDIIAMDEGVLVFTEVKYRADASKGYALEAVDRRKQKQIRFIACQFLSRHKEYTGLRIRFDAAGITGAKLNYIKNAF